MNPQSLSDLIALGEGFTTEFKRAMPSDLGREICAFANATGGVIMLGVSDAGEIRWCSRPQSAKVEGAKHCSVGGSADLGGSRERR